MSYRHTSDMGEISGFGGGYESVCQDMLEAGVNWLVEARNRNQSPDLRMHEYQSVFGLLIPDSDDAKELERTVLAVAPDCTGAMHHAVMSRLFYISKNGWDAYCNELRSRRTKDAA